MEPDEDEDWCWQIGFSHWHVVNHGSDVRSQLVRCLLCNRKLSRHALGGQEKVKVVSVIHHVVNTARRAALPEINAVCLGRQCVAAGRRQVVASTHIGVRRHVDQVAGAGGERFQTPGTGQGALRMRGSLGHVDVVVIRADVVGVASQYGFQHSNDLFGVFRGKAVETPLLPRAQVHQTLRIECGRVEILRVALGQLPHGVSVVHVELL